jgi:fructuronate reductase
MKSDWPIRIIHLGLGRFHRAHQAVYFQELAERGGEKWGIAAFSMRSPQARDDLRAVNCEYPVLQFSKDGAETKWIHSIREAYFAQQDRAEYLNLCASPDVELLTLTVTEKAYQTAELMELLYAGLQARRSTGRSLTVLSCDNLKSNGQNLRQAILKFSHEKDDAKLTDWIEGHVAFPNSMVDRIVPALSEDKLSELQSTYKIKNRELVATEGFTQWVIEDAFSTERPPLDQVGVQFVSDAKPFEEMKLLLLNASHSLIAYAGLLSDYRFVHEAIRDPEIRARVLALYNDVIPLLESLPNFNLQDYTQLLLRRFDNERLPHSLLQIAMDGSQKLQQRIVPSLKRAGAQQRSTRIFEQVLEDWAAFCYRHEPSDPIRDKIARLKASAGDFARFHAALLSEIGVD